MSLYEVWPRGAAVPLYGVSQAALRQCNEAQTNEALRRMVEGMQNALPGTPAQVARNRLRHIIAADRAAVPCGRWVLRIPALWRVDWGNAPPVVREPARYRYEVRR